MSKHTPGPWEVDGSAKTVRAGIGVSVAFCGESGVFGADSFQSIGTAEARANARLIASAPDLLEAAQAIADSVLSTGQIKRLPDSDGYYSEPIHQDEMAKLLAAIAKATGND